MRLDVHAAGPRGDRRRPARARLLRAARGRAVVRATHARALADARRAVALDLLLSDLASARAGRGLARARPPARARDRARRARARPRLNAPRPGAERVASRS